MKRIGKRLALAAAALLTTLSVQAGVLSTTITFDPLDTSTLMMGDSGFLLNGDEFYQPGLAGRTMWFDPFSNHPSAQFGDFVGAIQNGACADLVCPVNNQTNYISMLNDGVLAFGSTDGFRFSVKSLSASFVAGFGDALQSTAGFLALQGVRGGVSTTAYFALNGLDANNNLNFATINTGAFGNIEFDLVYAFGYACPAPGAGNSCVAFSSDRAQFAVDNIVIEHVPEPASLALLAIAGLAAGRVTRRRAA